MMATSNLQITRQPMSSAVFETTPMRLLHLTQSILLKDGARSTYRERNYDPL